MLYGILKLRARIGQRRHSQDFVDLEMAHALELDLTDAFLQHLEWLELGQSYMDDAAVRINFQAKHLQQFVRNKGQSHGVQYL
ncbi:hypothetical protein D3C72_1877950 [compost metagenome]